MKKHILTAILMILVVAALAVIHMDAQEKKASVTAQKEEQVIKAGKKWTPEWVDFDKGVLKPIQPKKPEAK